tara:strand:+ start:1431 stop:2270 length:840 start_codon:yes stop_codon:yes gene_type:complete
MKELPEIKTFEQADKFDGIQGVLMERASSGEIITEIQQQILDKAIYEFSGNVDLTFQAVSSAWQMIGNYASEIKEVKGYGPEYKEWFVHIKFTDYNRNIVTEYADVASKTGGNETFALRSLVSKLTGKCMRQLMPISIKQRLINDYLEVKKKGVLDKKRQELITTYATNIHQAFLDEVLDDKYSKESMTGLDVDEANEMSSYIDGPEFNEDVTKWLSNKIAMDNKVRELAESREVSNEKIAERAYQYIKKSGRLFSKTIQEDVTNKIIGALELTEESQL